MPVLGSNIDNLRVLRAYSTLLLLVGRLFLFLQFGTIVEALVIFTVVRCTCRVLWALPIVAVAAITASGAIAVEAFYIQWLLPSTSLFLSW